MIVSQKGGLTRYRMNDRVQVAGRYRATPCLRFVGRASEVSDLVGEKLHERFVREALEREFPSGPAAHFQPFLSQGTRGFIQERRMPPSATLKLRRASDDDGESRRLTAKAG